MSLDVAPDGETADVGNYMRDHLLETEDDKRMRIKSLRIIYFTMFLMTLGFSIILTGVWPYLDKVSFFISCKI